MSPTVAMLWDSHQLWVGDAYERFPASHFSLHFDPRQLFGIPHNSIVEMSLQHSTDGNVIMLHLYQPKPAMQLPDSFRKLHQVMAACKDRMTVDTILSVLHPQ